ncbi:hypothetical protein HZU77_014180 [Neisseriaceae bacterium TC5R-5]|nr:hypothetical protein [Neisseriaceae bacterium TC5R-5]
MKLKACCIIILLASSAVLSSCAYVPPNQADTRRVSSDYTASGSLDNVRAYVYGNHTIIEFEKIKPAFLIVRDQTGEAVKIEKIGHFYRLDRPLDSFTVWLNGSSSTFKLVEKGRVFENP